MSYRIIKDGNGDYIPQRKFLFWWYPFRRVPLGTIHGIVSKYKTLEQAKEAINQNIYWKKYEQNKKYFEVIDV